MGFGRIKGITIEIEGKTTKLVDSMKRVDTQLSSTQRALRDTNKLLKFDPGNTSLLTQKQKQLKEAIGQTKDRLTQLKEAQKGVEKGTAEWDALEREIEETKQKLKGLEKEYKTFGSVATQKIAAVGEKMKTIGGKVFEAGQALSTKVTLPLAAAGTVATKKFAEVDKTMQLTNKTMQNSEEEAALLDKAMKDAAANSTFGMTDAATASLNFARAGLTAEEAAAALAPAMNLAAGEGGNLDGVSSGLVATINGFHGSFDEATKYADVFANACNNSALDVDSLSSAMSVAAPIFSAAGYQVEDAALYMGIMANNGIDADKAANSLKTGLARLVSPAKQGAEMMDQLGISVTNSDGTMKDSVTIQKELHEAFGKLSESEQIAAASAIFGKNQMAPWLALINTAPGDVSALSGALTEEGTTAEMAGAMMSGFGGSIEKLKSSVDVAATSFGQALAPTIQKVADLVQKATDWFNQLSPEMQQTVAKAALVAAAIGPVLMVGGKLISGIGTLMTFAPKIKAAIAAISFNPIVLGIAAAVAAGILIIKNWDKIKAFAIKLKDKLVAVWNTIKTKISAAAEAIKTKVTNAFNKLKASTIGKVTELKNKVIFYWTALKLGLTVIVNAIKTKITTVWNAIKSKVSGVVNGIKDAVTGKFNAMKESVKAKVVSIKDAVSNKFQSMKESVTGKIESLKSSVASKFSAIKDKITSPIETAREKVKSIVDRIKSIFSGLKLQLPHFKLPHIKVSGGKAPWGIGGLGQAPSFGVSWYKKAYNNPVEFKRKTVIPAIGKGFGDGNGSEIVWGKNSMLNTIRQAVGEAGGAQYIFNIYTQPGQDAEAIARHVEQIMVRKEKQRRTRSA